VRQERVAPDLSGVPETMLWPLWNRAAETGRRDRLIDDPMAVELVERIDYDFKGRFGKPTVFHPIRARVADDLIKTFVAGHPERPMVIALGEGLETQLWRLRQSSLCWCSVDLPEAIDVRKRLLPNHPEAIQIACSALDPGWMDAIPPGTKPFISAAGLLMYFTETEVRDLLARMAPRFPGAEIFFDTITPHVSLRTQRCLHITKNYKAPPMPWGVTVDDLPAFMASIPSVEVMSIQSYADPFPDRTRLYKLLSHVGPVRRRFAGGLVHVRTLPRPRGAAT